MEPSTPVALGLLLALIAPTTCADVMDLPASRDNSVYSENGGLSNGAGGYIFTGKTLGKFGTDLRRALLKFDVAANIPAGSTINSATLRLNLSNTRFSSQNCAFHRLLSDWGEGTSDAAGAEGQGTTAVPPDATWTHSFFSTIMWTTNGGDFNPTASATTAVGSTLGPYDWTSEQLAADVQDMLGNPGTDFGWILIGNETSIGSAKRFDSRTNPIAANQPKLTIDFTPPPPAPFTVGAISPIHAALDVAPGTAIAVTFNDTVNNMTIDVSSYRVWGKQTGFKIGTFTAATFDPLVDFHPGEEVQVMLNGGVESDVGTGLTPHLSQFTVAAGGGGTFLLSPVQMLGGSDSFEIGLGDLDGDGDLDAFVANNDTGNTVWTNDGSGVFANSGQSLGSAQSLNVALGDLDGDGDLDAFVGNDNGANAVWLNNGAGFFGHNGQFLGTSRSFGVELGDLDGDGDLDAFVSNNGAPEKVWTNDGNGTFSDSGQNLGAAGSRNCALGDLDGDGDLDAFVAVPGAGDDVWINDGSGTFSLGQSIGTAASFGVALGDLDGDGDLDAFASTVSPSGNIVWINDGSGSFADSGQLLGTVATRAVRLGDVDGDGDLDAFAVNNAPASNEVWTNDGSGAFSDSGVEFGDSGHRDVAVGDVDGDGDLDVLLANQEDSNVVFLNFHSGETGDFDSDGIPNNAEVALGLDPADPADAAADLDGDRRTNLEEFLTDTDLTDPSSFLAITSVTIMGTTKIFFAPSSIDRIYALQWSSDLQPGSWLDVPEQVDVPGVGGVMMLEDASPATVRRFYRVGGSLP